MYGISTRIKRFGLGLGLAATMALSAVMPTLAADGTVTITGGTLAFGTAPVVNAATGVNLTGLDTSTPYTINLDVNDPTGTGAGWNVTMTSTTFAGPPTGTTEKNIGKSLATNASTIAARPATTCYSGSTCTLATDGTVVSYPYTVPAGTAAPTATKMYSAAASTGLGRMTFSPSVSIAIPANTYAGTYTSTVTLSLVSAP